MSVLTGLAELFIGPELTNDNRKPKKPKRQRVASGEDGEDATEELMCDDDAVKSDFQKLKENVVKMMGQMGEMLEVITKMEALNERVNKNEERVKKVEEMVKEDRDEMQLLRERNEHLVERVEKLEARLVGQEEKGVDLEARSRRKNLLFHGLKEEEGEDKDWDVSKKIALNFIKNTCKLQSTVVIERAHRIGRPRDQGARASKPRPLIVAFHDYNDRMAVKKAKAQLPFGGEVGISEDLPRAVREARRRLHPELERRKAGGDEAWIKFPARLFVNGVMTREEPVVADEGLRVADGRQRHRMAPPSHPDEREGWVYPDRRRRGGRGGGGPYPRGGFRGGR